jgi:hypothetical protein
MMDILRECLAADPSRRLSSAAALRDELAALLEGGRSQAPSREWQVPGTPSTALTMSRSHGPSPGRSAPSWPGESLADPAAGPRTEPPAESLADSVGGPRTTTIAGAHGVTARTSRRRPPVALAAVGGGVAVVAAAALLVVPRLLAPSGGPAGNSPASVNSPGASLPGAVGVFGVATTAEHCPAASVAGAGAACVKTPECWAGVNEASGVITVKPVSCSRSHSWQTFAIAMMPTESATVDVNIVQANPTVRAVCSTRVLLASRTGAALQVPPSAWQVQVAPPDEAAYNAGVRTYRCLAGHGLDELKSSQFGP